MYSYLKRLIVTKKAKICVIGLGYVGLPMAVEFTKKGFCVYGFDKKKERIAALKKGASYIDDVRSKDLKAALKNGFYPTPRPDAIRSADIIIICVPTPLRKRKIPDISYIIDAARNIYKYIRKGQLIILESTTYPGTTRDVILPILKKSGLRESKDFFLSFSPERIDPGNKKFPFKKIPKIVGGLLSPDAKLTKLLYSYVIDKVYKVSTLETAEVVKLLENTFRIVNIGLINEFAMLCNRLKIDVWEVVEAAKTKPFGFMPFYPGPGIGGHCIPLDPLYLSWKARRVGFRTKMIDLASRVNLFMPHHVVQRVKELLSRKGLGVNKTKILILGVSYKKDIKDLRESPALDIIELLQQEGADISYSDPHIPYLEINSIHLKSEKLTPNNIRKNKLLILTTDHKDFDYRLMLKNANLILDTRNVFERLGLKNENIIKL